MLAVQRPTRHIHMALSNVLQDRSYLPGSVRGTLVDRGRVSGSGSGGVGGLDGDSGNRLAYAQRTSHSRHTHRAGTVAGGRRLHLSHDDLQVRLWSLHAFSAARM